MSTGPRRRLQDAQREAEQLRELFAGTYERWEVAGSVRRQRAFVGDVEHVIIPRHHVLPGLFGPDGQSEPENLLLKRSEELLAAGTIGKACYGSSRTEGTGLEQPDVYRWGEKYRGLLFHGQRHEIFTAEPDTWGCILAIRTGPMHVSRELVTMLKRAGMFRQNDGRVERHLGGGQWEAVPCRTEEHYFELCGVPWKKPEERE